MARKGQNPMIMLIAAIIALVCVAVDYLKGGNWTPLGVAALAIGHIIDYLA